MVIAESRTIKYLKSSYIKDCLIIVLGSISYVADITGSIMPSEIATGGLAGICLILNYKLGADLAITYWIINFCSLVIGFKAMSRQFTYRTLTSISILSTLIWAGKEYPILYFIEHPPLRDDFLNVIMGGLLCGTGLGLVYPANGSTSGTDIIGSVITKYYSISIARILLVVDACIVLSSCFVLEYKDNSFEKTIYGFVLLPMMWQMVEIIINGARQSVQLFIFSKHYDEIATRINSELKRGCTIIDGIGWYSKSSRKIVIVIARRTEANSVFRLVRTIDPFASVTKANVMGVCGNGFDKLK